jgi:hypothetical protein
MENMELSVVELLEDNLSLRGALATVLHHVERDGKEIYNEVTKEKVEIPNIPDEREAFLALLGEMYQGHGLKHLIIK